MEPDPMAGIALFDDDQPSLSPLVIYDRLLSLAQEADQAGLRETAEILLDTASKVLDCPPAPWTPGADEFSRCPAVIH